MRADLDLVRARHRFEWTEQRQLEIELGQLGHRDGRKPWIGAARGDRAARDDEPERFVRLDVPDAPAQIAVTMERHERARVLREHAGEIGLGDWLSIHVRGDRVARQAQQRAPVLVGRHVVKLPSAAAIYPTTADLSPETSPESA